MDQKNWQQVQDLFESALNLPEAERNPFLEAECDADVELLQAVTALLQHHSEPKKLDDLVRKAAIDAVSADQQVSGARIGPWAVIEEIGRGGMGTVYLAERADQHYHQKVAIKLITGTYINDDVLNRFIAERQILAKLEHQNIARLLDGGATDKGAPYLVMEYIEGQQVDVYCNQNQLSVERRLVLFRKICAAVQFAHQNLIVHRDLKPSNILIDKKGEPHLLDFGIAKLLQNNDEGAPADLTAAGVRVFTPHYSSPEQIKGEAINTQSDVYSLGVILFELLTGRRPYQRTENDSFALEKAVVETQIVRPSSILNQATSRYENLYQTEDDFDHLEWCGGLQSKQLKKLLSGDLDNILLKALRKSPHNRYASVAALSVDLGNYLTDQPITARPATFAYRSRKFFSRHPLSSIVVTGLTIAVIGFSISTWLQSRRIADERDAAQLAQTEAETISDFLVNMFATIDPQVAKGHEVTVREVLDDSAEKLNQPDNPLHKTPGIEATIRFAIGDIYLKLGLPDNARGSIQKSLDYYRSIADADAQDMYKVLYAMSAVAGSQFDLKARMAFLQEAKQLAEQSWDPDDRRFITIQRAIANTLQLDGKLEEAQVLFEKLYAQNARLFGEEDTRTIGALDDIGTIHYWLGNYDQAVRYYQQCSESARQFLGELSLVALRCLSHLGSVYESSGQYDAAAPVLKQHIRLATRVLGENHPTVLRSMHNYADSLRGLELFQASEALFLETLNRRRQNLGEENFETLQTEYKLARLYRLMGRYEDAYPLINHALTNMTANMGRENPSTKNVMQEYQALLEAAPAIPRAN